MLMRHPDGHAVRPGAVVQRAGNVPVAVEQRLVLGSARLYDRPAEGGQQAQPQTQMRRDRVAPLPRCSSREIGRVTDLALMQAPMISVGRG